MPFACMPSTMPSGSAFGALPERYNWQLQAPDVLFYPLRPELVESTYLLYQVTILTCCDTDLMVLFADDCYLLLRRYFFLLHFPQATKNPFYLHVGMDILQSLEKNAKVRCGSCIIPFSFRVFQCFAVSTLSWAELCYLQMWVRHSPPRCGQIQRGSHGELLPQWDLQIPLPGKLQPEHVRDRATLYMDVMVWYENIICY